MEWWSTHSLIHCHLLCNVVPDRITQPLSDQTLVTPLNESLLPGLFNALFVPDTVPSSNFLPCRYPPHHPFGSGWHHLQHHTLKPIKELSRDSQKVEELASKLHVHSSNYAAKLVHTRHALSSTIINTSGDGVSSSLQPLLVPIDLFLVVVEFFYSTRYQRGSFSLINVGSGFSLAA